MIALLGLLPAAAAATIAVPGDYSTVQEAVDAASSGDTVTVATGTWSESITISTDLSLVGVSGTILEADDTMALTVRTGATVDVSTLEIVPGDRGVWVQAGAVASLTDVVISGHSTGVNGVGAAVAGTLVLDSCEFSSLDADDAYGAALYVQSGGRVEANVTTFDSNSAATGGAIYIQGGTFSAQGCAFSSNEATSTAGGAIFAAGESAVSITSSTFESNAADQGGAIAWTPTATSGTVPILEVTASSFDSNSADDEGGAVYVNGTGTVVLADDDLIGNTAPSGGALYLASDDGVQAERLRLCGNAATDGDGGAVLHQAGGATYVNLVLQENTSTNSGGGIWLGEVEATVVNAHIVGNDAAAGAGVFGFNTTLRLANSLIAWSLGAYAVESTGADLDVVYNDWYTNSIGDIDGDLVWADLDSSNGASDPLLSSYVQDGDCTNDVLWPLITSPLVDAGDPAEPDDPDETRCDIGAYGGAEAYPDAYLDADEDAWIAMFDCDDEDATSNPSADEWCDEVDNDCDGDTDEDAVDGRTWYQDMDGDTWGDLDTTSWACDRPAESWIYVFDVSDGMDCNDEDATIHPDALEFCDGVDEDCDGSVDEEAVDAPWWHLDADGDGYGVFEEALWSCDQPPGYVAAGSYDCDDEDFDVHPDAEEVCDGVDNDCDTGVDGSTATDAHNYYLDADGDGYGDADHRQRECERPEGWVRNRRDCDDSDPAINPDAEEIWYDAVDQDCAEDSDFDQDRDGVNRLPEGPDCDDTDPGVRPGATELADDGVDQDCDGEDLVSEAKGCSSAGPGPWWLALLPLAAISRRRRRA